MDRVTTINISMPESLGAFVKQRVAKKGYGNTSEYFRQLVREDRKRTEDERLEALLLEGLASGKPVRVTDAWWRKRRQKLAESIKRRKTG